MAQTYKIEIRVENDVNYNVCVNMSSDVKHTFNCTKNALKRHYKVDVEDLNLSLIRKIIKEQYFLVIKEVRYDSSVISFKNNKRTIDFQIEDGLVLMHRLDTKDEFFIPLSGRSYADLQKMTLKDFNKIKLEKKKITPFTTRIQTNDFNFEA